MGVEEKRVVIGGLREEDGGDWLCKASSAAGEDISKGGIVVLGSKINFNHSFLIIPS